MGSVTADRRSRMKARQDADIAARASAIALLSTCWMASRLSALLTPRAGMGACAEGSRLRRRQVDRLNSSVRMRPNQRPQHSCSRPLHSIVPQPT